ncbi:MAG: hypothetical protein SGI73_05260 [Chloroflexota bacterium]|nr:hypothetical protein [Chloroflexota bacterium]
MSQQRFNNDSELEVFLRNAANTFDAMNKLMGDLPGVIAGFETVMELLADNKSVLAQDGDAKQELRRCVQGIRELKHYLDKTQNELGDTLVKVRDAVI